jgi:hypothetical protein
MYEAVEQCRVKFCLNVGIDIQHLYYFVLVYLQSIDQLIVLKGYYLQYKWSMSNNIYFSRFF